MLGPFKPNAPAPESGTRDMWALSTPTHCYAFSPLPFPFPPADRGEGGGVGAEEAGGRSACAQWPGRLDTARCMWGRQERSCTLAAPTPPPKTVWPNG